MERVLKIEPKNYLAAVDISADDNDDIPMPKTAGQPVKWVLSIRGAGLDSTQPPLAACAHDASAGVGIRLGWCGPGRHQSVGFQRPV